MHGGPCERQQQLIEEVQHHLLRLSELAREEAVVISTNSDRWLAIDKQIEQELGEKERCLGALRQHREEHGC